PRMNSVSVLCFFFQAEDGIRDRNVTGVQTCALPISSFDDARTPQCDSALNRMTAWNVVDYSDNRAVVDYFVPMEDASTGGVLRMSVEWQDNDWKLSPSSFDSYHQAIENLSQAGGTGRAVDLEEFTQW